MLLWGLGQNLVGELATGDDQRRDKVQPQRVPDFAGIALRSQRVLGFGPSGLWSWGNEFEGRLALTNTDHQEARKPIANSGFQGLNVVAAATGDRYGYAQVQQGMSTAWFWWGRGRDDWNRDHRLPSPGDPLIASPFETASQLGLVSIAADDISVGCSSEGHLYTWRPGAGGPLGHDPNDYSLHDWPRWTDVRQVIPNGAGKIVQADTLGILAAALDEHGRVYFWIVDEFWLRSQRTELTRNQHERNVLFQSLSGAPRHVLQGSSAPFRYIKLAADGVLYGINDAGELWAAGANRLNVVPGVADNEWTYGTRIDGLPTVVQAVGHRGHAFALDATGEVWHWGKQVGSSGLIDGPEFGPQRMPEMRGIRQISALSANFLALGTE